WEVRVRFTRGGDETFSVVYGDGPSGKEKKVMRQLIAEDGKLGELLKEWEKAVKVSENLKDPKGAM
ncbi:MAG: hypothetical protein R3C68_04690, partial [Myxococcota bacterium]